MANRKKSGLADKEQSARFVETAQRIGVDESGKLFERAFKTVVPEKRRSRLKGRAVQIGRAHV